MTAPPDARESEAERIEAEIDAMADDGRLGVIAKRIAIESGCDWTSLDGDQQDAWHERAIGFLRRGSKRARRYAKDAAGPDVILATGAPR